MQVSIMKVLSQWSASMDSWAAAGWLTLLWHLGGPLAPGTRGGWCRHLHANLRRSWGPRPVNSHTKKGKKKKGRRRHPFIQSGGPSEHFYWKARLLRSLIWYQAQIFGGFSVVTEQKSARGAPTRVISRSFSFTLQDQSLPSTGFKKKIL